MAMVTAGEESAGELAVAAVANWSCII